VLNDQRLPMRFWDKVEVTPSGCWAWTGYLDRGYGKFKWMGRMDRAHRVAMSVLRETLRSGFEIDHLCRNRACVNPEHLEQVTHTENVLRAPSAVVWRNRDATHHACGRPLVQVASSGKRGCRFCSNANARARRQMAAA